MKLIDATEPQVFSVRIVFDDIQELTYWLSFRDITKRTTKMLEDTNGTLTADYNFSNPADLDYIKVAARDFSEPSELLDCCISFYSVESFFSWYAANPQCLDSKYAYLTENGNVIVGYKGVHQRLKETLITTGSNKNCNYYIFS